MAKHVLLSLFVIILTLSSFVRAHQPQPQTSTSDQKQTAPTPGDKQAPANSPVEPDDRDSKLAVYRVHQLAGKILALRSDRAKPVEIARLASVLWNHDEARARILFQKALYLLMIAKGSDPEPWVISVLHHRVVVLIAGRDAEWAQRLIDSAAKREGAHQGSKSADDANLITALGLLKENAPVAVQFAERSLKAGVPSGFLDFILALREKDEPEANKLFLQGLNSVSQQPPVDIRRFFSLGLYLFTAPIDSDHQRISLVDKILVPNITADRPSVPTALVRAYLATAVDVLWRATSDSEQRKYGYSLCYMLLPKSRNVAPDLTPKLDAVMAALTAEIPTELTKDSALRYMNAAPTTVEEKLTNAENKPDHQSRDMAFLEIAFQAWRKGDLKTARIAQGRISEMEASQRLAAIIEFGDGAWTIKQNSADISKAEVIANRLPQGIERSILLRAIAKVQGKRPSANLTEETVVKSLKAAHSMSDGRRPFLLLTAAAQLANLKSPAVHNALAEAVKDFNSFEESTLAKLDWTQSIQIGPMNARFPLDVAGVDFSFNEAFRAIALADPEAAMARAEELRHENLRAQGLVEVGRAFLEKPPQRPQQKAPAGSKTPGNSVQKP